MSDQASMPVPDDGPRSAVIVPLMVALAQTVTVFTASTSQSQHRSNVNSETERILQRIAGELTQTSTRLDHWVSSAVSLPQSVATAEPLTL